MNSQSDTYLYKLSVIVLVDETCTESANALVSRVNKQTLSDMEFVFLDCTRQHKMQEELEKEAQVHGNIKVLSGDGEARFAGLAEAFRACSGEFIHVLHGTDKVLEYSYESLYNKMNRYRLDCIKFDVVGYSDVDGLTVYSPQCSLPELGSGDFHRLLTVADWPVLEQLSKCISTGIYRSSFIEANHLLDDLVYEDSEYRFFWDIVLNEGRIAVSRDRLFIRKLAIGDPLADYTPALVERRAENIIYLESVFNQKEELDDCDELLQAEWKDCITLLEKNYDETSRECLTKLGEMIDSRTHRYIIKVRNHYNHAVQRMSKTDRKPEEVTLREYKLYFSKVNKPKVSVVVPIFNQEEYLNEALNSLVKQKLDSMEFICINDGSTDRSMTILNEYAAVDKRIIIIDKKNTGYGNSMNLGIDAATGTYLGILEPDDFVPDDMYMNLYGIASLNDLDLIKADFYRFVTNKDGTVETTLNRLTKDRSYYNRIVDTSEELDTFLFIMNTWSGIYRLSFLNKHHIRHNETPGASYQDNGFWFQTFCHAKRAMFSNIPYYMNRRDNPNSSMFNKKKFYSITEEYKFIKEFLCSNPGMWEKYKQIYYRKKYGNFIFTYHRIASEYKLEYLRHIRDEFAPVLETETLDSSYYTKFLWKSMHDIVANPEAFWDPVKVSVIIPAYNAEKYIRECLDPLLVRDEVHMEVICVDDGSTDNTLAILKEYEERDSRVRVISQPNAGAGAARNNGMKYASGEYLSFLDADDIYDPEMLRTAYENAYTENADVVVYGSDQYIESEDVFKEANYTIRSELLPAKRPFAGSDIKADIFKAFVGWPWDKLFRAEFVRANGLQFQEQRTSNDMLFVFSAIVRAERIITNSRVMVHHRRAAESLSVTREKSWRCFYDGLCALRQQLIDWNVYERFERDFINYALHFSLWNLDTLAEPTYSMLYDLLKREWFDDLGVTGKDKDYFYNLVEYDKLCVILESTPEEYLFYRIKDEQRKYNLLQGRVVEMKEKALIQNDQLRKQRQKASHKQLRIDTIKASRTFQIGKKILYIPRKIKSAIGK